MNPNEGKASKWWNEEGWNRTAILCQDIDLHARTINIWSKDSNVFVADSSLYLFQHTLVLVATTLVCFLLKPLKMSYIAQMIGGVLIGILFPNDRLQYHKLLPPTVIYIMNIVGFLGFFLHSFMLGVETNMSALRRIGKKSIIICFSGLLVSAGLCYATYHVQHLNGPVAPGVLRLGLIHSQNFFMVTCTHTNELGISNSEVGRLAAAASMILDIFSMFSTFAVFNVVFPLRDGGSALLQPITIIAHYVLIFTVFRPIVLYIIRLTPEGSSMKQSHFVSILALAFIIACLGELSDHRFSLFLFALTLPEEPLTTIMTEKLDPLTTGVFFPMFCALCGLQTNIHVLSKRCYKEEIVIIAGYVGKFLGTLVSSVAFGLPYRHAICMSLIMSSKGLFDIVLLFNWRYSELVDIEEYTLALLHILITTGGILPLVRLIYEPSTQYSAVLRQTLMASFENGTFQTLVCIHKERNTSGILRLIEAFHPTRAKPIPVIALQLLQLTGRASLPILAPLYQVKSSATFRSNLDRCNRIVKAFLNIERESRGFTKVQHYISVAPHELMHNDICNLAYEKNVSLLILPFHIQWTSEGLIEETSPAIREVNKMVLQKAPCSVGLFVERGEWGDLRIFNGDVFRVAIIFIGGADDHEALAYSRLFATNPCVRLLVVWLRSSSTNEEEDYEDYEAIHRFLFRCSDDDRVSLKEVIADDGADTTKFLMIMKDAVDLVVVGRHHDYNCAPVFGLSEGWNEHPELGMLGATLATCDFKFSLLVVQQEPREQISLETEETILI